MYICRGMSREQTWIRAWAISSIFLESKRYHGLLLQAAVNFNTASAFVKFTNAYPLFILLLLNLVPLI